MINNLYTLQITSKHLRKNSGNIKAAYLNINPMWNGEKTPFHMGFFVKQFKT